MNIKEIMLLEIEKHRLELEIETVLLKYGLPDSVVPEIRKIMCWGLDNGHEDVTVEEAVVTYLDEWGKDGEQIYKAYQMYKLKLAINDIINEEN